MKKTLLMLAASALFLLPAETAYADKDHGDKGGLTEAVKNVIDDVVETFTGDKDHGQDDDSPGAEGRENALEHIDRNIEKHGGEHKGLENAREHVSKSGEGHEGDENSLIEDIVEELGDGAKEEIDDIAEPDAPPHGKAKHAEPSGRMDYHGRPAGKGPKK